MASGDTESGHREYAFRCFFLISISEVMRVHCRKFRETKTK